MLQSVAVCVAMTFFSFYLSPEGTRRERKHIMMRAGALQHVAVCYSELQCVTV